jgi:two-component system NtrC family sensor kinase
MDGRPSSMALLPTVRKRTADLLAANAALVEERTRQAALIKQFQEARSELLQSERMASIGQLAAGVAHEINNPVAFVKSNLTSLARYVDNLLELLAAYERIENQVPESARAEVDRLRRELDLTFLRADIDTLLTESADGLRRLKRIVVDLQAFSHVDGAEWQWANLERGLESTLNVVWNEIKCKADVIREYGGIPEIECVPSQINQVFMNLLLNAAQAIEERGRVTLRTGADDERVWVEVADTGKGIAPEHLSRIFDPFFTTKPGGKGVGLGLSLSYRIVKKHCGHVEVTSEPGKGSLFRVTLPRHAGYAQAV